MGKNLGRQELPESDDEMRDLMAEFCKMCGRFQDRKFLPAWYRGRVTRVSNLKLGRMHILNGG